MGRTLVGRATFSVAIVGIVLAQIIVGCGNSSNDADEASGGKGAGMTGGTSNGGDSTGDSGGPGDSAGAGDTGSGGARTSGGSSATGGRAGSGGVSSGGQVTGSGGKSGSGGGAGSAGSGGSFGLGGSGGGSGGVVVSPTGGFVGTGGSVVATGGAPSCLAGVPCNCKKLVGTTECGPDGVATCSCPPAAECAATAAAPCFEPCGGDPFGAWVLEEGCFSATAAASITQGCQKLIQGTPGAANNLRLRILDGGEMQLRGTEDWSVSAQVGLACLSISTVNSCTGATFWPSALLFGSDQFAQCTKNACGVCDCVSESQEQISDFDFGRWSREGTDLQLGFVTAPYCVTGNELWVGGDSAAGDARVSYKFKKQSCAGTPTPCAQRSAATCAQGDSCMVGFCKATATGTQPRCSTAFDTSACSVLQGCVWDPTGCAGTAGSECNFDNCEIEPGCTWGAPRERCGGLPDYCEWRDLSQCAGGGCAVRPCQSNFDEFAACGQLENAADCGKAPGCVFSAGVCTGNSACTAQTDVKICEKLQCRPESTCSGTPTACSALSVANCHSVSGCRLEW